MIKIKEKMIIQYSYFDETLQVKWKTILESEKSKNSISEFRKLAFWSGTNSCKLMLWQKDAK